MSSPRRGGMDEHPQALRELCVLLSKLCDKGSE